MVPFVAVHLALFITMPFWVAMAALVLAVVTSFPMAQLFELGGATIWPPALMHFVIQGTVKVIVLSGEASAGFPLVLDAGERSAAALRVPGPSSEVDGHDLGGGLKSVSEIMPSSIHLARAVFSS